MVEIKTSAYSSIFEFYKSAVSAEAFFPLIGAVLTQEQVGSVFVDSVAAPNQIYVEHSFGFAQVFGNIDNRFESALEDYFFRHDRRDNAVPKIRLYGTLEPKFLAISKYDSIRSKRQRFRLGSSKLIGSEPLAQDVTLGAITAGNVDSIEKQFGIVARFWRNADAFLKNANSVLLSVDGEPAAICYSAANSNGIAEIDVLTREKFRKRGFGKAVVTEFIRSCRAGSLEPSWDCFTNNSGSMQLCQSVGFSAFGRPYPFYTIHSAQV